MTSNRPDADVASTQSRQKKGQKKSIFLSASEEEAIVEIIKQHEELFNKTHVKFKDKQRKGRLLERYGKLTQTKSGQAAVKSTERQTCLKDTFSFLCGHIRRKGVSKLIKSPLRPSAATATASVPDTSRETESVMEISMASDVTHQLSTTSPS